MTFLYLYSFMGFACLKLVTPDFGLLAKVEYALEGAFRYTRGSDFVAGSIVAVLLYCCWCQSGSSSLLHCSFWVLRNIGLCVSCCESVGKL